MRHGISVQKATQHMAGKPRALRTELETLVVRRMNGILQGREQLIPPRLLQGMIPSALLDSCRFWQGEDLIIRGSPRDMRDEWFNYKVEIEIKPQPLSPGNYIAVVTRKDTSEFRLIDSEQALAHYGEAPGAMLTRTSSAQVDPVGRLGRSRSTNSNEDSLIRAPSINTSRRLRLAPLVDMGFPEEAAAKK